MSAQTSSMQMATPAPRTPRLAPEERRVQLLDAALDVVAERGFGALTVEAIAVRAGVTRPVVYDAFGDLESLKLALLDHAERGALEPLLEIVDVQPGGEADPDEFLRVSVLRFLEAVRDDPRTWRLVLAPPHGSSPELAARIRRSRRLIADHVQRLLAWGLPLRGGPSGLDLALAARLIVAAGEDAARLMLSQPSRFPPERLGELVRELVALLPRNSAPQGNPPPALADDRMPASPSAAPAAGARRRVPRAERREQLLDVALALLSQEGFDALTMEAIARRAGVNRVVVYRSFANLQVLLAALLHREERRVMRALDRVIPTVPATGRAAQVLGDAVARMLAEVLAAPRSWRVALLRPEDAPVTLRKLIDRRRAAIARRLEPVAAWGLRVAGSDPEGFDLEALARMLLSVCEEQARLLLDDPEFDARRLLEGSWALLDAAGAAFDYPQ
jgi:AcrR family transcriptional regulator